MSVIETTKTLKGSISSNGVLTGKLSVPQGGEVAEIYSGSYEVTPHVSDKQVLNTAKKLMTKNVTINPIPYSETTNSSNGKTVYIGGK